MYEKYNIANCFIILNVIKYEEKNVSIINKNYKLKM